MWIDPEDIMLNEILVTEEQILAWFLLYELSKVVKLTAAENKVVVARGLKEEEEEKLLLSGYKVTVTQDEKLLDFCCETWCLQ